MLHITEDQVRELLTMRDCIRLMREVFKDLRTGAAINQPRRRLILPTGSALHSLAGAWGKYFGTKIYAANPKFGVYFFFLLFDAETAKPLAQFEANYLGQIRTGAASGYATDVLAAPDASTLAIIGSGFQARTQFEAIREVRAIKEVRVWSRDATKRDEFAKQIGATAFRNQRSMRCAERISWRRRPRRKIQYWNRDGLPTGRISMPWDRTRRRGANCRRIWWRAQR